MICCACILGDALTIKPKDDKHLTVVNLKDIPSSELNQHILQDSDDKSKLVKSEKTVDLPVAVLLKPFEQQVSSKPKDIRKGKSKLKKRISKLMRKELKELKRKNNRRQQQLKTINLKSKKNEQKRNKWKLKEKKQPRTSPSNKLTKIIDSIMSYHKEAKVSKLTTQEIRKQILNLLTANKGVIKPGKNCPKPKIGKNKVNNVLRKRLRSLKRSKMPRKRPIKAVILNDRNRSKIPGNKRGGRTKIYETKEKKGKVKSKTNVRLDKKNKKRLNKKKVLKRKKQKKENNV